VGDVDNTERIMRRQRWAYRRGLLNTAIARGTWGDAPIPPDLQVPAPDLGMLEPEPGLEQLSAENDPSGGTETP
jgi:hypothetical protein